MVYLNDQDEKKYFCPYCGYEMESKTKRCANCASILDEDTQIRDSFKDGEENKSEASFENESKESDEDMKQVGYEKHIPNKIVMSHPRPLTNALKVLLTTVCVMIPVIGQFLGVVISIIYMNSQEELKDCDDRRSFGLALLIACVVAFMLSCIGGFAFILLIASIFGY